MSPDQLFGILQLLADLRIQLGQALTENALLRAQLDEVNRPPPDED